MDVLTYRTRILTQIRLLANVYDWLRITHTKLVQYIYIYIYSVTVVSGVI